MIAVINNKSRFQMHIGQCVKIVRKSRDNKVWIKFMDGREMCYNISWLSVRKDNDGANILQSN